MRKIFGYILLLALLCGISWLGWIFFNRVTAEKKNPVDGVPQSAALVLQLNNPMQVWKNLSVSNLMWDGLRSTSPFSKINLAGKKADSLFQKNPRFAALFTENPLVVSCHFTGNGKSGYIFTMAGNSDEDGLLDLFTEISSASHPPAARKFKNDNIYECVFGTEKYYLVLKNGFISLATHTSLSEEVVMHIDEGKTFSQLKGFSQIFSTANAKADATLYIHHATFSALLQSYFSPGYSEMLQESHPFAFFTGLDLYISSGSFSMNGFSAYDDSSSHFLSVLHDQQPQVFTAGKIIPENAGGFCWIGFNDGESFYHSLENYYAKKNTLAKRREEINTFNTEFDCNITGAFIPWTGNEMVLFSVPSQVSDDEAAGNFLALKCNELAEPIRLLNELGAKLDSSQQVYKTQTGLELRQLKSEKIFSLLFGELFSGISNPWYFRADDFVVFCNSPALLEKCITDISTDRSLKKNISFSNFSSLHFSDKSNALLYTKIPGFGYRSWHMAEASMRDFFFSENGLLNRFETFSWQLTNNGKNLFYNNVFLGYNSTGKQNSDALWEISLDTGFSFAPVFVQNHITQTRDVFVQDDNYTAYLINNKGDLLWKKELEEKITGEVQQIDYYKNGKLQLLFCTSTQLHIIDLRGTYVEGFPLNLGHEVTATPAVFDYENNGNYRICIAAGNKILNLEKNGKPVTGWAFTGAESAIVQPPVFFRAENKDYIFCCDKKGNLYILDRKGNERYSVNLTLEKRSVNPVILEPGSTIENTKLIYSDSNGLIGTVYFNGNIDSVYARNVNSNHFFTLFDVNNDRTDELVLLDSGRVSVHAKNGKLLFSYEFPSPVVARLAGASAKDGNFYLGAVSLTSGEIYVIRADGSLHPKFPLTGTTLFNLNDINNDGSLELAVCNGSRRLFVYSFK